MPCAARFSHDRKWYRAQITALPGRKRVQVFYVDYGNQEQISWTEIRKLHSKFLELPPQVRWSCTISFSFLGRHKNAPTFITIIFNITCFYTVISTTSFCFKAIHCTLAHVTPLKKTWTDLANSQFEMFVAQKTLRLVVEAKRPQILLIALYDDDVCINTKLTKWVDLD